MNKTNEWEIEVMGGGIQFTFDTVLVMQQPGNSNRVAISESKTNRCFTELSGQSSLGYVVIGRGIVLESNRSDETDILITVAWKRNH